MSSVEKKRRRKIPMKKIIAMILALVMVLSLTACGSAAKKDTYTVGICQLLTHPALDAATQGFKDAQIGRAHV